MMFRRFSFIILIFSVLICYVYADDTWTYKILETETSVVDEANNRSNIDYEKREITLPRQPLPNISDFMPGEGYNYALLKEDGVYQYYFDGEKMREVAALKVAIDNPLAVAASPLPYTVTVGMAADDGTNDLINYTLEQGAMKDNPILSLSGLQTIYSIATFKSTGELAVLQKNELNIYTAKEDMLYSIPKLQVKNIVDPIAVATASDYNFAILEKNGLKWYTYNGSGISQIPAMSLTFDETMKKPKALSIKDDMAYILDDKQLKAYKFDGTGLKEHAAFSITTGLVKPYSVSLSADSSDLIIIDGVEGSSEDFKLRYFMFNGEKMVENPSLALELKLVMAGLRYMEEGEFITNAKTATAPYADYIKVKAYCEVPKDTEITFYVSNEGDTISSAVWYESWRVRNSDGAEILEKAHRKTDGTIEWLNYGAVERSYPSYVDITDTSDFALSDDNLNISEDADGKVIITPNSEVLEPNLWTYIPIDRTQISSDKYRNIRIKAVLKTLNPEVTPKIFAPIGTNNEKGIMDVNQPAIMWQVNASPEPVDIGDIDNGHDDALNFEPIEGWVYTTTPEFTWNFSDPDTTQEQSYFQLIVVAKDSEGDWKLAYDSLKREGTEGSYKLPTSDRPDVAGPLWASGSYQFATAVRVWDSLGAPSDFSEAERFNVLAYERPRISNIVNPPEDEGGSTVQPVSADITTHKVILPGMDKEDLPNAKAGAEVTILIDSVGPIESLPNEISKIYILDADNNEVPVDMGECTSVGPIGEDSIRNRWMLKFWTKAPIKTIPDNTVVMMKLYGKGTEGGTTVFYVPDYADGIITTKETIYEDWQVVLEGSER